MKPLNVPSKNGEKFFHQDGLVYHETYGNKVGVSIEYMIQALSHNKCYPQIKFDRQYELIYDKPNKYVIGDTLHNAFCKLMIKLFQ